MPNHVTNRIKFLGNQEGIDKYFSSSRVMASVSVLTKSYQCPTTFIVVIWVSEKWSCMAQQIGMIGVFLAGEQNGMLITRRSMKVIIRCGLIRRGPALYPYSISLQKYAA